jgi:alpha-1,3-rhamnosyl/mannosyltransferase
VKPAPAVHLDVFAALIPGGGIGRFVRLLVRALEERADAPAHRFVVARNVAARARKEYPNTPLVKLPLAWRELAAVMMVGSRLGWRFDRLYGEPAVVHSPAGYGPRFRRGRLINHVHDITYWTDPQWHTRKTSALQSTAAPVACRAAARVLTDCEFVRRQVIEHFGVAPGRVLSIPLPLDPDFRPLPAAAARAHLARRFGLAGPFVLHVSTLEPRKNQARLVEAYGTLRRAGFPGPLVLVGRDGWRMEPILARIEASPYARDIRRLTDADDRDLVALYGAATFSAFPSLSEGFGYPLLESMACGTPCVISDHEALLELAAGAAPAVPALEVEALAAAMIDLWRDDAARARFAAAGLARAAEFGFDAWAERMFAVYREELAAAATVGGVVA